LSGPYLGSTGVWGRQPHGSQRYRHMRHKRVLHQGNHLTREKGCYRFLYRATREHDRSIRRGAQAPAAKLRCGSAQAASKSRTSTKQISEQSRGKLVSSDTPPRAPDATIKSPEQVNDFLSAHAFIYGHFHPLRHQLAASAYRALRTEAFNVWQQDTCVRNAA
jgi:hypothetical protein